MVRCPLASFASLTCRDEEQTNQKKTTRQENDLMASKLAKGDGITLSIEVNVCTVISFLRCRL